MGRRFVLAVLLGIIAAIIVFFLQKNNIIKTQSVIFNETELAEKKLSKNYLGIKYFFADLGGYVEEVIKSSPADLAGFKKGDIIVQINGERIDSDSKISEIIMQSQTGATLTVVIKRNEEEKVLYVQQK